MYSIRRGALLLGHSRLEIPQALTGEAHGVFQPGPAFPEIRDRLAAELVAAQQTRDRPDLAGNLREILLLAGRPTDRFQGLSIIAPDRRILNARVIGFAETAAGQWLVAAAVNDAEFWQRAATGTL